MTTLKLRQRWLEEDGNPIVASECGGDLYCFFCGEYQVAHDEPEHKDDCIFILARQIVVAESGEELLGGITPSEDKRCPKCDLLAELYEQAPQTPHNYWVMTELFVHLHGSDVCGHNAAEGAIHNSQLILARPDIPYGD